MSGPEDRDLVLKAIRLGWYVAEARGRNRPDAPAGPGEAMADRSNHALPLRTERTPGERRIESQAVLAALARTLKVDVKPGSPNLCDAIAVTERSLAAARKAGTASATDALWSTLTEQFFDLDAFIQDTLAAASDIQACGYQLGRGLAESYWALRPDVPDDTPSSTSWNFLLGPERCGELARLVGRLSVYLDPYTAPAVAGSLEVWKAVVADPDWRGRPDAVSKLYLQIRRWYELIILGQDPSTVIAPFAMLKGYRTAVRALRIFWPQLVGALLSLGAVGAAVLLMAAGGSTPLGKSLIAAVGVVGLSVTSVYAKLKTSGQALLQRIRDDAYTDLISVAVTVVPDPPSGSRIALSTHTTEKMVAQTVRRRGLTNGATLQPVPALR